MILFKNSYFTFWHKEKVEDKYIRVRLGSSESDDRNGEKEWINSTWFATFVGKAKDKAANLEPKDQIIANGKISNVSKKQNDGSFKTYLNVVIWDFTMKGDAPVEDSKMDTPPVVEDEEDGNIPF